MPGIEIIRIRSSLERVPWLENFAPQKLTWVVTDVRSKVAVQRRLLEAHGFVEGTAVLRVSELWTHLLRRLRPDLQIVSRELVLTAIGAILREREEPWLHAPGAAKTAFEYIRQLLPILVSSGTAGGAASPLEDWFEQEENKASKDRWKSWYQIALEVWRRLDADQICASSWVAGALAGALSSRIAEDGATGSFDGAALWNRDLIFDLGAELSHVEADLLLTLARNVKISIFRPAPAWEADYPDARLAVDWMEKEADARGVKVSRREAEGRKNGARSVQSALSASLGESSALLYKRLPSAAAEVKDAVARVREWLEAGVAAPRIAIVAPDLEVYWPVLSLHLESEGVPANKAVVSALHSFSDIARWLARLRLRAGLPESRDLEADLFGEKKPPLNYASFRELFSRIYEQADLELSPALLKHYESEYRDRGQWSDDLLSRDAFLARALGVLNEGDDRTRAIRLFKAVLEECPPDLKFNSSQWVRYLSELAAKTEIKVIPEDPGGVACLNLSSLEGVECSHIVVMGLHEGALRSQHGTVIHTFDLRSIENATGWIIDGEDRKRTEFEARWVLSQARVQSVLLFADADVGGTVQTPSWMWIAGAWGLEKKTPEIEIPKVTRFDELQSQENGGSRQQRERMSREKGEAPPPKFAAGLVRRLSATTVDSVSACSLRFAFDRILGARDEGRLDLDADHSRLGSLQHKIFELIGTDQWKAETDDEIYSYIDRGRREFEAEEEKSIVRSEEAWQSLRRRLLKVTRGLVDFERRLRAKAPQLKTVAVEAPFKGQVGGLPLSGRIDRIDSTPDGRAVIVDYKSNTNAQNFSQWSKGKPWQPILYAWAVDRGLVKVPELDPKNTRVVGAFLYNAKKRTRGNGLRINDGPGGNTDIFEFGTRGGAKGVPQEDLDKAYAGLEAQMQKVVATFETGEFIPVPASPDECKRCRWREACRAPHLELL